MTSVNRASPGATFRRNRTFRELVTTIEEGGTEMVHSTMGDTLPNTDGPGGTWTAACTCGWTETGRYARTNEIAEAVALLLANLKGQEHERTSG